ncbi:MAG: NUDIX domain-containing protein [Euryarchaeota archaeon]|jgi:8-oxo-dGTP diphosphatase|nr:NUDIX domain-containing protein [Euryarchaeota archaeon]
MIELVFGLAVRALITDDDGKILILKRSSESMTNPDKWELPGGKVDQGESFDQALKREVKEETNLTISLDHVVGVSEQNLTLIRAVHIILSARVKEGELHLSSEHDGYAWVYFDTLPEYELADWLEDYVKTQIPTTGKESGDDQESYQERLKPWLTSLKSSVDNLRKKK